MADRAQEIRTPPGRHTLKLLVVPIIGLIICSQIANATWATLHDSSPLLLIALSSLNRYLILVSDQLDAWSYYLVGSARLLAPDPFFYMLGLWYGEKALAWVEHRSKEYGPLLRKGQGWFGRFGYPLVFIAPNNIVCLFAGAARMRVSVFLTLNISGTFARLYLIRVLGDQFSSPIDSAQGFIGDYRIPILVASVILVAITMRQYLSPGGRIDSLRHIDEDLLDGDDADAGVADEQQ